MLFSFCSNVNIILMLFLLFQGIKLLLEDLIVRKQKAFLWRWKESVMTTVLSFDPELKEYFYSQASLEQLLKGYCLFLF